jgi:hypothetical protein
VARAIKEIILGMKSGAQPDVKEEPSQKIRAERVMEKFNLARKAKTGKDPGKKSFRVFLLQWH